MNRKVAEAALAKAGIRLQNGKIAKADLEKATRVIAGANVKTIDLTKYGVYAVGDALDTLPDSAILWRGAFDSEGTSSSAAWIAGAKDGGADAILIEAYSDDIDKESVTTIIKKSQLKKIMEMLKDAKVEEEE
jgi:hypothetical protein